MPEPVVEVISNWMMSTSIEIWWRSGRNIVLNRVIMDYNLKKPLDTDV
jgi:hypothetical protein